MSDIRCPKRSRSGLVALAESNPSDSDQHVVVGDCVRSDAAERSGLLSGIANTDGLASLPANIYPEDVQLWQAACVVDCAPSTDELVTIIRVAEALDDEKLPKWTEMLGKRAFAVKSDNKAVGAISFSLLSLPPHLLHAVLTATDRCSNCAPALMRVFPAPLRPALLAVTARNGNLLIHDFDEIALDALATATVPPTGLLALRIGPPGRPTADEAPPSDISAALLVRAAAAHPTLAALRVTPPLPGPWLAKLATCLHPSALPGLAALEISTDANAGGYAVLSRCLKCLPRLESLHATFWLHPQLAAPPQTIRALVGSAACPACLPRLTVLHLSEQHMKGVRCSGSGRSPNTREPDSAMLQLLPLVHAPAVTALSFTSTLAPVSTPGLLFAVRHLTALKTLSLDARLSKVPDTHAKPAEPAVAAPPLQSLEVRSGGMRLPLTTAAALAASSSACMTRLHLAPSELNTIGSSGEYGTRRADIRSAWKTLTSVVVKLQCLQSLQLEVLSAGLGEAGNASLAAALTGLTHLTHLSLQSMFDPPSAAPSPVLCAVTVGPALQQLLPLKRLNLCENARSPLFDEPQVALNACSALCALTELRVLWRGVVSGQIAAVAAKLTGLSSLHLRRSHMRDAAIGMWADGDYDEHERFPSVEDVVVRTEFDDEDLNLEGVSEEEEEGDDF